MSSSNRRELLRQAAERGKYSPLYEYLVKQDGNECQLTFSKIEEILNFALPNSARIHRPWWANQGERGGHSHALSWEMAGWKTTNVNMEKESIAFVRKK
jgi:hypothetical protein